MGASIATPNPTTATATPATAANQPQTLAQSIPGLDHMSSAASGNILNLLSGSASPSKARTTNAYWGVGAGQPATSDINSFIGQRGTDLYGQQANANQQTGLQDLLSMIQGYSGNVGLGAGQQQQGQQFTQSQAQQAAQFGASLAEQQREFNYTNSLGQFNALNNAMQGDGNQSNPFAY